MFNFFKTFRNQFIISLLMFLVIIFVYNIYFFVSLERTKNTIEQSLLLHIEESGDPHNDIQNIIGDLNKKIELVHRVSFWILMFTIVFASSILINIIFNLTFSLREILDGIKEVEAENLEYRIPLKSKNEFGIIAKFFNKAIESVEKSRQDIQVKEKEGAEMLGELNVNLRKEIARQTAELRKRLEVKEAEIEELNKRLKN